MMSDSTSATRRIARRAARRVLAARAVRLSGRLMLVGSGVGLAGAVPLGVWFDPTLGLSLIGACVGVAGVAGVGLALARPTGLVRSAARVDEALGLHDRLSSALELDSQPRGEDPAFTRLAITDAERCAAGVRVRRAVPIRASRDWVLWPVLSAAAVAALLVAPEYLRRKMRGPGEGELARVRESLVEAARVLHDADLPDAPLDPADRAAADRLSEIERELLERRRTPDSATIESAAVLDERARVLREQAEREARELTSGLSDLEADAGSSVGDLADALRESDFPGAGEQIRELVRRAQSMDETERQRLAEDLRDLAERLAPRPSAPSEFEAAEAAPPETESPPADQQPPLDRPASTPDEQSPSDSQPPAQPTPSPKPPAEELSERLSDLADQIERDPQSLRPEQPSDSGPGDERRDPGEQAQPDEQTGTGEPLPSAEGERPPPSPEGQDQTGTEQRQSGGEPEQRPGDPQPSQGQPDPSRTQPGEGEGAPKPDRGPPGPQDGAQPGEQTDRANPSKPEQQPTGRPEQPAEGDRPLPGQEQPGQEQQGDAPREGSRVGQESGSEGDAVQPAGDGPEKPDGEDQGAPGDGDSLERALDQLEKMDQRQLDALRNVGRSEQMREMAEKLLDEASPEDRQRLSELARRLAQARAPEQAAPEPWSPETEVFDARPAGEPDESDSRVVGEAERTGDDPAPSLARTSREELSDRVREAVAGAERAIEGQSVPPRAREYVRKVYRRYEKRTADAPVKEGRDADAPSPDDQ